MRCPCVYIIDLYSHKHKKNLVKTLLYDLNATLIQRIPKNLLKSKLTRRRVQEIGGAGEGGLHLFSGNNNHNKFFNYIHNMAFRGNYITRIKMPSALFPGVL